ncbi:MAG: hypothetical protein AAGI01_06475 [Myxococcota bacterium]
MVCASLGRLFSLELRHVEEQLEQRAALKIKSVQVHFLDQTAFLGDVILGTRACAADLFSLFEADGIFVFSDGVVERCGALPEDDVLEELIAWIREHAQQDTVYINDAVGRLWPGHELAKGLVAGVVAIPLSRNAERWVVWTRREQVQIVRWGGDVRAKVSQDQATGRLRPRASFSAWKETVRGHSLPFTTLERQAAHELHQASSWRRCCVSSSRSTRSTRS